MSNPRIINERPSQPPFRLFDLPAELRIRIYEAALYHDETGGTIAPQTKVMPAWDLCFIDGAWRRTLVTLGRGSRTQLGLAVKLGVNTKTVINAIRSRPAHAPTPDILDKRNEWGAIMPDDGLKRFFYADHGRRTHVHVGHVCSFYCLLQPAMTRANRRLRHESLSIFYSMNAFELVFPTFESHNRNLAHFDLAFRIRGWWTCIGDAHLQVVPKLRLAPLGYGILDVSRQLDESIEALIDTQHVFHPILDDLSGRPLGRVVTANDSGSVVYVPNDELPYLQGSASMENLKRSLGGLLGRIQTGGLTARLLDEAVCLLAPHVGQKLGIVLGTHEDPAGTPDTAVDDGDEDRDLRGEIERSTRRFAAAFPFW